MYVVKHYHLYISFINNICRTPTRSDHEVRLSRPPPPTHPRHLAQRLKSALLTVPRPQTHTFSESSWQELFKDGNVTQIQRQWQLQIRRRIQRQRQRDWKLHFRQSQALKPIHFLKAHVNSYSKTATWHKYKDKYVQMCSNVIVFVFVSRCRFFE